MWDRISSALAGICVLLASSGSDAESEKGSFCNSVPVGLTTNFLPYRTDATGDCKIDFKDVFELALNWGGGLVERGYRVDAGYLVQMRMGLRLGGVGSLAGDANLDGLVDNEDFELFTLNENRGLTDCGCGNGFPLFPFTLDLNEDGRIDGVDSKLFNCVFATGRTCTPTMTPRPSPTRTPTRTPSITNTATVTQTPSNTLTFFPTITRTPSATPIPVQPVNFPDGNLEFEVRRLLNKMSGDILNTELRVFTTLNFRDRGISNLEGIQFFVNLVSLNLNGNGVRDLQPIQSLQKLVGLFLESNRVSDLTPLLNNPGISSNDIVDLTGNPLSDDAQCVQIPILTQRGASVLFDRTGPCFPTETATPSPFPSSTPTPPSP